MRTVIVTGGIGSGKSAVCALLQQRGIPVYNCDARVKELYRRRPSLVARLEKALDSPLRLPDGSLDKARLAAIIFGSQEARETLESIVYPVLLQDFRRWRSRQQGVPFVVLESAVILSKPVFDGVADAVVLVDAPQEVRLSRVMARDGASREAVLQRMAAQQIPLEKVQFTIGNGGSPEELAAAVERVFFHKNDYICKLFTELS